MGWPSVVKTGDVNRWIKSCYMLWLVCLLCLVCYFVCTGEVYEVKALLRTYNVQSKCLFLVPTFSGSVALVDACYIATTLSASVALLLVVGANVRAKF